MCVQATLTSSSRSLKACTSWSWLRAASAAGICIGGCPKKAPGKGMGLGPAPDNGNIGGRPAGRGGACRGRGGAAPPMSMSVKVTSSASLLPSSSASACASAVCTNIKYRLLTYRRTHKRLQVGGMPAWYSRNMDTKSLVSMPRQRWLAGFMHHQECVRVGDLPA